MSRVMKAVPAAVFCALVLVAPSVRAYWTEGGIAACSAIGHQYSPRTAPDGEGGAIITWYDVRGASTDIYAQRVDAVGTPKWAAEGVPICTLSGSQVSANIVSDGAGGAIIAWIDYRNGNADIYAQRVNGSGAVQWTAGGIPLCTATATQSSVALISDGAGGAIVAWEDNRSGNFDIYAQRVSAAGIVRWTADGVALCTAAGTQWKCAIDTDNAGGAIVAWEDQRGGNWDIYTQKVDISGNVQWTADGVALCTAAGDQRYPKIATDVMGAATVAWQDERNGNWDIYARRVSAVGSPMWAADGVPFCTALYDQEDPVIVADEDYGVIVAWTDYRYDAMSKIHAQRANILFGNLLWTSGGVLLCTADTYQLIPRIVCDGDDGAIVAWVDYRSGNSEDIYCQHVDGSGAVRWAPDGVRVCAASGNRSQIAAAPDGAGGALIAWRDERAGDCDIYIQSVDEHGRAGMLAPAIHAVSDVPGDQGGQVYLTWYAARSDRFMTGDISSYSIWRAISPAAAAAMLDAGAQGLTALSEFDPESAGPVVRIEHAGGLTYYWELVQLSTVLFIEKYGDPVATLFDSTAVSNEHHYFQVIAQTSDPLIFWTSAPDSGYSVDNLSPCPPLALAGEQGYEPGGLSLTWAPNEEPDIDFYRVYRGLSAGFEPTMSNMLAEPPQAAYFDDGWRWSAGYHYKVSAVDVHGNESGYALFSPDAVTGDETPSTPESSYLSQNYPNPFNPSTRIEFGLAEPAHVSLRVYDASGRLVLVIADEYRPAGRYAELWDGRDGEGRVAASGVYFFMLSAGSLSETRKMILLR